ncbi:MAG: transglutaminase domain-containing protein, partial [Dehalococcoidia bacterium]|nr:transglutaminase domain-containing protein [Dehalococcoidia bacterium]
MSGRLRRFFIETPRLLMSWEDWLTFAPALVVYIAIAVAIQQAEWVRDFPSLVPAVIGGLIIGLLAARTRASHFVVHPVALLLGLMVITLTATPYGDGGSIAARVEDVVARMNEWVLVVREDDVSNDNLPFVLLVHTLGVFVSYLAAWAVFRWRNAWIAVAPACAGLLVIIATTSGRPSGAFLMFSFGALLLISRLHLQRAFVQWDRARVEYPEWLSLQSAQLTLVLTVVMVVIAWQVPLGKQADAIDTTIDYVTDPIEAALEPVSRLFNDLAGSGGNFHKFGRTLPIRGDVSLGSKVLFEVRGESLGLVRGTSYDEYTGSGWRSSGREEEEVNAGDPTSAEIQARAYRERIITTLDIEVFDDEETLFSVGTPLGTNIDSVADLPESFPGDIERIRSQEDLQEGDRYRVAGTLSIATPDQLRADGVNYPDWVRERYLQLPDDLPERVGDEAARVTEGVTNPYDLAKAIEAYILEFELDMSVRSAPSRRDVVDFFLFDLQRGYFDYFSTAMT